ncbi:hypothetical protein KI387_037328 [Taxus chinensis]|uniref:valine--tRNA ligase n=1 Tax=Taxus chinensis TaxID=29808 RepID=A0AA38FS63_TAXCH|nr:hypothetical protein KI387_037328 [Taxus chinensis]
MAYELDLPKNGKIHNFDVEDSISNLCLSEQWVVTKLHELIDSVTSSYERFYYGEVGRAIYDFFWSEFADWYIECSKTRFIRKEDTSTIVCAQAVLLYVFENILKLLHPFMPYVTEELWQALPARNSALIVAEWPKILLPRDAKAVEKFENLQALIRAIRNARAEYSVEPAQRISATIVAAPEIQDYICKEKTVLAALSRLDIENLHFTHIPPEHAKLAVHLIVREGLEAYLPITDMIDVSTEIKRVSKRLAKLQSEYDAHTKSLTSPNKCADRPKSLQAAQGAIGTSGTKVRGGREKPIRRKERKNWLTAERDACGTSGPKRREPAEPGEKGSDSPKQNGTSGTNGREPTGSPEINTRSTEQNGTKGRAGRGSPKKPKANKIAPRVIGQMRDKEAHFGRIGGFCPKRFGTSGTKRREGRERAGRPAD